jgi:hypothetical protein
MHDARSDAGIMHWIAPDVGQWTAWTTQHGTRHYGDIVARHCLYLRIKSERIEARPFQVGKAKPLLQRHNSAEKRAAMRR